MRFPRGAAPSACLALCAWMLSGGATAQSGASPPAAPGGEAPVGDQAPSESPPVDAPPPEQAPAAAKARPKPSEPEGAENAESPGPAAPESAAPNRPDSDAAQAPEGETKGGTVAPPAPSLQPAPSPVAPPPPGPYYYPYPAPAGSPPAPITPYPVYPGQGYPQPTYPGPYYAPQGQYPPGGASPPGYAPYPGPAGPPPLGLGLGATAGPAGVRDEGATPAGGDEDAEAMRGLVISATAMTNVGTGTFIREPFVRNPYVDWSLGFQPSYTFEDATALSLQGGITQEITNADGVNDPNQVFLSDLRLGVQRPLYTFERSKTAISGGLRVSLPTSLASRTETLYTALQAQASVSQPLGDFILTFTTSGRKNFHKYTTSVVDIFADRGAVQAFAREGGNERISAVAVSTGNNNVEWVWSNSLGVNYGVTPEVNLGLSYTLAHSWTYDSFPVDEFSGVGAREGRGQRDASAASLSGSYQVMENVGLAAGLQTISTPRQADGRTLRFPFYEFQSTAFNLSTIFVSVTFTEPVRL